ncbi:HAD-IA family hydrolase [Anaeromyxobacter diazotrophicus]|uniref:phosphoglycolate phosphatase n=1 Tax=Anaeromyxobacter diazotrophicus TaxID=2590199 RepID=A0A7I9VFV3_9BACT|nr:HAD-IA family hydrolase [Anaeromyxobacter diazotrophicus]GEJ55274.1 haloacid dehalogenase [Anaeromyxobacter diazotrophicus]
MTARSLAVLLDLDGTLVDTVPFILQSVGAAFEGRARRPSEAEWLAGIGQPLRVQLAPYATGPEDLDAILARYRAYQREHHDRMTRAFPGAVEAVRAVAAAGHRVGVVTGKLGDTAQRALELVGLAPFVQTVVAADSCPEHKPDPAPVLLALARLGRPATEALFLGDAPVDLQAGRAAGVTTVAALWGAASREVLLAHGPAHLLEDVSGLPALVARLAARSAAA